MYGFFPLTRSLRKLYAMPEYPSQYNNVHNKYILVQYNTTYYSTITLTTNALQFRSNNFDSFSLIAKHSCQIFSENMFEFNTKILVNKDFHKIVAISQYE